MGRAVIIDTNLLIEFERGTMNRLALDDDQIAVAAITIAEYRTGIELAVTQKQSEARQHALNTILDHVVVLAYTEVTAQHHAGLIAHARRSGRARGAYDLIIAAHAAETGRILISRDARARYGELPGVLTEQAS